MTTAMRKTFFACLVLCGAAAVSAAPKQPALTQEAEHQQWVAQSLAEMHTVKVGMTRADLKKVFYGEGGLYSSASQSFIYRGCPYFKVHVGFKPAGAQFEPTENPKDTIVSLSEPFIDDRSQQN